MAVAIARSPIRGAAPPPTPSQLGKSFRGFCRAVAQGDRRTLEKVYGSEYHVDSRRTVHKAALSENAGTVGGYIVPVEYSAVLMRPVSEESFFYPRALVVPMTAAEVQCPTIDATTVQSSGVAPYFGGMTFTWGSEQAPAETEPTFRQVSARCWDLIGYSVISNQLLADIGPVGGDEALLNLFGRAAAWYAEYAFLRGTGAANLMPQGIVTAPATIAVTRSNPNQVLAEDISTMADAMLALGWQRSVWACNPTVIKQLVKLPYWAPNQGAVPTDLSGYAGMLLSRPLFVTDKLPALGTRGDLCFFDPSLYVVGDRGEVLIDLSPYDPSSFVRNQSTFRVWLRMDGKPMLNAPVTLSDATTQVSPYVVLV